MRHVEKEKRHWATMENFNSQRIAINPVFYKENDRLLEGGLWAEVTLAYNEVEEDDYAFSVQDLRPIQLSRFDSDRYMEGRKHFSTGEWMDVVLRSVGLEPSKLDRRLKLHFVARLLPLVEPNYNFIEVGTARNRQVVFLQRVFALRHFGQRRSGYEGNSVLQQCSWQSWPRGLLGYCGLR